MSRITKTQKFTKKSLNKYKCDKVILFFVITMAIFGSIMIFDASVYQANTKFDDPFYFLKSQLIWLVLGTIPAVIIYFWDYRKLLKLSPIFYILIIIILSLLLIVGQDINGSKRWFTIGPLPAIQPAEFAKIAVIAYLAKWLSSSNYFKDDAKGGFKDLFLKSILSFGAILSLVIIPVFLEPDLGTTVIIAITAFIMFFVSRDKKEHGMYTIGTLGLLFTPLVAIAAILEPYRLQRVATFLNLLLTGEVADPQGSGYQMQQILIGIGSGGLLGTGFGQSRQRFGYLVENTAFTDSIFAVILEEIGFIGGTIIILAWIFFLWRGLKIAMSAPDKQGKILATGITVWLVLQALINMAANVGLVPLTGIPAPFLTYGGSSTIVTLIGIGILLNISKYSTKTNGNE